MKKLMKPSEHRVTKLRIHRETLRQLERSELQQADGGFSSPSICMDTTVHCCVTL
jgi:hypothetical protein